MTDLISRQAAYDTLIEHYNLRTEEQHKSLKNCLSEVPTIDAVPVVRCKDCKHRDTRSGLCEGRGWPTQLVTDDGFCDKGEMSREE